MKKYAIDDLITKNALQEINTDPGKSFKISQDLKKSLEFSGF